MLITDVKVLRKACPEGESGPKVELKGMVDETISEYSYTRQGEQKIIGSRHKVTLLFQGKKTQVSYT